MEWWVFLLIFIALLFVAFVIYFSFLVPKKEKRKRLAEQLKKHPNRVVVSPENVKLFTNFKFHELPETPASADYLEGGIYGFYVDTKMAYKDDYYPIYLAVDEKSVWNGIQTTKNQLLTNDPNYQRVYDYLTHTNQNLDLIKFFIIEDYNPKNYAYWNEVLEADSKGFNQ